MEQNQISISRIYPNDNTQNRANCINKGIDTIPSKKTENQWFFKVIDEELNNIKREYFLLFGTKSPIHWLSEYRELKVLWDQFLEVNSSDRYYLSLPLIIQQ